MRIRLLRDAEQQVARRIILDGLGDHFDRLDESFNPDLEDIGASYLAPGHRFVVAETGGKLVGTGALVIEEDNCGRIVRVAVAHEHRRQGIGSALVTRLVSMARRQGLTRLWVETNDDWTDAIGLYLGCGFREYARSEGNVYFEMDLNRNPRKPSA